MTLGALGYVGYAKEAAEGDLAAPTIYLPVRSFGFPDSNDFVIPAQIRNDRDSYIAMAAPFAISGNMEMDLIPQGIVPLLLSAFSDDAASTVAGADPGTYVHTIAPGKSATPTLAMEGAAGDIMAMRYGGVKVNSLELKAAFGEIVTATFGFEGTTRAKQATLATPDFTAITADPFHFSGAEIKVDGTQLATAKDFTFGINNNIERIGTLRKTRSWKRMALGMRELSLGATLDFTDTDVYDDFLAETYFTVDLNFEGAIISGTTAYKLTISLPKVKWNKVGLPLSASDYLEQSAEAMILRPVGSDVATVTLTNDEPTP